MLLRNKFFKTLQTTNEYILSVDRKNKKSFLFELNKYLEKIQLIVLSQKKFFNLLF